MIQTKNIGKLFMRMEINTKVNGIMASGMEMDNLSRNIQKVFIRGSGSMVIASLARNTG